METFSALLALCGGEFTGDRRIPLTKASDAQLWCFLWSAPEWTVGLNDEDAGDLRHHRTHYDVIAMLKNIRKLYRYQTTTEFNKRE